MKFKKIDNDTHIYVEGGETEQEVLRAIVKASFMMAKHEGIEHVQFTPMKEEMADLYIDLSEKAETVISMGNVLGYQCKTVIFREGEKHFMLHDRVYESDGGTPDTMLEEVNKILLKKKQ